MIHKILGEKRALALLWGAGYCPAVRDPSLYRAVMVKALVDKVTNYEFIPTKKDYQHAHDYLKSELQQKQTLKRNLYRAEGPHSSKSKIVTYSFNSQLLLKYPGHKIQQDLYKIVKIKCICAGQSFSYVDISRHSFYEAEREVIVKLDDNLIINEHDVDISYGKTTSTIDYNLMLNLIKRQVKSISLC